jgi:hypothetical protein
MLTINKRSTDLVESNVLTTEASTIGLKPGEWPDFIAVVNDANNGFLFGNPQDMFNHGELGAVNYTTKDGAFHLTVFND